MGTTGKPVPHRDGSTGCHAAPACDAELCDQTQAAQEAIRLTQLGARAGLVARLTGLEKTVANRLYRQLHGRPSPPGQLPFTDSWYLRQNRRMAQATLVWQLSQRFAQSRTTPAQRLIDVYECCRWLEPKPLLDIAAAGDLEERRSAEEELAGGIAPLEKVALDREVGLVVEEDTA